VEDSPVEISLPEERRGVREGSDGRWPTASVILHFCDRGRYPIVDVRALWSLGVTTPPAIDFPVWMEYTRFLRGVSADAGVSMRTLDRALWQYSKVKG
jgi:hypothetical protein